MNVSTLSRDTTSDLLEYIRRRGYVRGDRLPSIRQLADALGVGRNAVRDGILHAQARGLVKIEPRVGVFVQSPNAAPVADRPAEVLEHNLARGAYNVFHLIDARLLLEWELVGKAARAGHSEELLALREALEVVLADGEDRFAFIRADEAFHLEIARLAGNPVLLAVLRTLLELLRPVKEGVLLSAENRQLTDREHVELYRSLLDGKAEEAQSIMREHIAQGRALLLQQLRTVPAMKDER
ncbi:MAG: FadR/GntR family transcriptional regulator [Planctomycetaceae bacterium]